jgi:hypothetical protein
VTTPAHQPTPRQTRATPPSLLDGLSDDASTIRSSGGSGKDGDVHRMSETVAQHLAKADRRPADTIWRANPREQGLIGLTDAIAWFGANGYGVLLPLIDAQPYDLVVDGGEGLQRVQVKTTTVRSPYGVFVVSISTNGGNQSFHTRKPFDRSEADLLYVLTDDGTRYLIPTVIISSRNTLNLGERVAGYRLD